MDLDAYPHASVHRYYAENDIPAWIRDAAAEADASNGSRLGSVELIDDSARARAVAAVALRQSISLARPVIDGPSPRNDELPSFRMQVFAEIGPRFSAVTDHASIDCHGSSFNTHIDATGHVGVDGTVYGGAPLPPPDPAQPVRSLPGVHEGGADISVWADQGILTRGVLIDVPAVRGTPWVTPDNPVSAEDIDEGLRRSRVDFVPEDALLLYMGRDRFEAEGHSFASIAQSTGGRRPGAGESAARWIASHGVSALCWDFLDAAHEEHPRAVVHLLNWAIGLALIDHCDFGRAVESLRAAERSVGMLVVSPLKIEGGTGCLVNPLLVV